MYIHTFLSNSSISFNSSLTVLLKKESLKTDAVVRNLMVEIELVP